MLTGHNKGSGWGWEGAQYLVDILVGQQVGDGRGSLLICAPVDGVFKSTAFGVGLGIVQLVPDLLEQFQTYDRAGERVQCMVVMVSCRRNVQKGTVHYRPSK